MSLAAGSILCLFALVLLAGGGWASRKDLADRDTDGFVPFGTAELRTEQYAIIGDLRGGGASWLYGSTVLGDGRVRATSQGEQPLFIGIARTDDVFGSLPGAGYATIHSFAVTADTTHPARVGDWSVVLMNADASANVEVHGDASATLPGLPWLVGGFLDHRLGRRADRGVGSRTRHPALSGPNRRTRAARRQAAGGGEQRCVSGRRHRQRRSSQSATTSWRTS